MIPPLINHLSPADLETRAAARKLRGVFHVEPDHYHAGPGLSSTQVKKLLVSPAHFKAVSPPPSNAMKFGTALHMAVLEPERFAATYVTAPECDRRTKEGKATYQAFVDGLPADAQLLSKAEWDQLAAMARAMGESEICRGLLQGSEREIAAYAQCRETGVLKKALADILQEGIIADVKTCQDASPEAFARTIFDYGYHISAEWYRDVFGTALGIEPAALTFIWIAIEKAPPHGIGLYTATERMLELGRKQCKNAVEIYHQCSKSGAWPAYPDEVSLIDFPEWVYRRHA